MFFIMGSDGKVQQLGNVSAVCSRCGRQGSFSLCKSYEYIHLFFIPVFRYHVQYIATCPGCASVYAVDPEAGKEVEKGRLAELPASALTLIRSTGAAPGPGLCPHCGAQNPQGSVFCNQCGGRLFTVQ